MARHIGKFEQASGGTLFLDEIGDMPMQAQTRLLRTLQSGSVRRVGGRDEIRVDTRIIAATNRDLAPMIAEGQFREDLFYRLNVVPVELPALRERRDDIEPLARHFLAQASAEGLPRRRLSADAVATLAEQYWRGNVRELRNFIFRLALLARDETVDRGAVVALLEQSTPRSDRHLPEAKDAQSIDAGIGSALARWLAIETPPAGTLYDAALAAFERPLFAHALTTTAGNQVKAARLLGLNRNTLRKRLVELSISAEDFAARH
jgi:two-component system nitrogen regulation response regulator GlnG